MSDANPTLLLYFGTPKWMEIFFKAVVCVPKIRKQTPRAKFEKVKIPNSNWMAIFQVARLGAGMFRR
jgi:hypothetical protein